MSKMFLKLLGGLTLLVFVFAFAIPSLVIIESATAEHDVEFVYDHTTYYVCPCPTGVGWVIVDRWVKEDREKVFWNHPKPIIVNWEKVHVFHNITYNMHDTFSYSKLGSDDYRCEALED